MSLWNDVHKIEHQTRPNPLESQRHLKKLVREVLKGIDASFPWKRLWEQPGQCCGCQTYMEESHLKMTCMHCNSAVHSICIVDNWQNDYELVCFACRRDSHKFPEPRLPRCYETHEIVDEEVIPEGTRVKSCNIHGMDHLTRDPSCAYCKKAPLYRHLRDKYGTVVEDQTPTLNFDFSGPFPISATGARFMLLFVWRISSVRLLWGFALDHRTKENVRACLQEVVSEITVMTGGSKPPVMRCHSDQAGEFLSPVISGLKLIILSRLLLLHMTHLQMGWKRDGWTW